MPTSAIEAVRKPWNLVHWEDGDQAKCTFNHKKLNPVFAKTPLAWNPKKQDGVDTNDNPIMVDKNDVGEVATPEGA